MRKSIASSIAIAFLFGIPAVILAQHQATPVSQQQHYASSRWVFKGTIDSVSLADPTKGTKSEITVLNIKNKSMVFLVKSTTTLYSSSGSAITLDQLVRGNRVRVKYTTTAEGVQEAASIWVLKSSPGNPPQGAGGCHGDSGFTPF
jgi:hypothetical protein